MPLERKVLIFYSLDFYGWKHGFRERLEFEVLTDSVILHNYLNSPTLQFA